MTQKLVSFIKLQQWCKNQACCNYASFADLLQLVEKTCNNPVDNNFWLSICNRSVDTCDKFDNLQQTCCQQAVASHANASWYAWCQQSCCNLRVFSCVGFVSSALYPIFFQGTVKHEWRNGLRASDFCVMRLMFSQRKCADSAMYTAKISQSVQTCWKQHWTMFCCQHCSMLSTILFSVVTPDRRLIQVQQCWTRLLTTLNNIGSKTLFNAVFNRPEQVVRFCLCNIFTQAKTRKLQQVCWHLATTCYNKPTCCKLIDQTCYPQACCKLLQQVVPSLQMTSCDKRDFNRLLVATWGWKFIATCWQDATRSVNLQQDCGVFGCVV